MIDFHSHIIPNIDDGSSSMEKTLAMLEEAKKAGFTDIISTSHYIEDYYESDEPARQELLEQIQSEFESINLYLGSEVYYSENMVNLLKEHKASTINNSKYVLFEFSLNNEPMMAKDIVYTLISNDYIPIVAHPERYSYVQNNISFVEDLAQMGALFQANFGSIVGMYGGKAKKTVKKLLKEGYISFLGSDVHKPNQVYPIMEKAIKKIKKVVTEEEFDELTVINPQKVLNNEEI